MKIDLVVKIPLLLHFAQNTKVFFVLFQDDLNQIDSVDLAHPLIHLYYHRKTLYFGLNFNSHQIVENLSFSLIVDLRMKNVSGFQDVTSYVRLIHRLWRKIK
jgi:hypothetical protein